jgi:DMSO reductase family type II enzyme heme b subunit
MQARYVADAGIEALLDPGASAWKSSASEKVVMMGTPVGLQPTDAIRMQWLTKKVGMVEQVSVQAVHDGQNIAFRLEWSDPTENSEIQDTTAFVDAAGVLLPSVPGAAAVTMGAPTMPVNAWYWRPDDEFGREVVAEGIGTTRPTNSGLVRGRGIWKSGRWSAVITRPMQVQSPEPVAQLSPGQVTGYAVAVWDGSNSERGGLKAFSGEFRELRLDSMPTARR